MNCLGKHAAVNDPRTLKLARYLTPGLPPPPATVDWSLGLKNWGAMVNDSIGDCTIAAIGHCVQLFTGNNAGVKTISDADIVAAYSAVSGYNPRNGANDNGANVLQVLNYWRKTGVGGNRLNSYASIEANGNLDLTTLQQAIYLFGTVYIGVDLPASAQGKNFWDVAGPLNNPNNRPGSWGGHAINVVSGTDQGGAPAFQVVSWGGLIPVTAQFLEAYCDEAYALLSDDWFASGKMAPNCIDLVTLTADLQAVATA